jgi:nitroreductase
LKDTVLTSIMERSSYRGKYLDKAVPRKILTQIMEAGLAAPSGCNKQTTSLIAVDDKELLDKIKSVIDPPICQTAPAIICVLTKEIYAYRNRCYNVQDYSAAIENMLIAIKALSCESCWYEGHITDEDNIARKIADILGVPSDMELVCILPVGYPTEPVKLTPKKKFEERAWFNGYNKHE